MLRDSVRRAINLTERDWRKLLKKNHFCLDCRKQDAYTFGGHTYCYECCEKRRTKAKEYRVERREELAQARREKYADRKSERVCIDCSRPLSFLEIGVRCSRCAAVNNNRVKRVYPKRRVAGMCFQCSKNPPLDGKKLCVTCYEKNNAKLAKALEARRRKTGVCDG